MKIKRKSKCVRCDGARVIKTMRLGQIRCPDCTRSRRKRMPAREMGKLLSAADARRADRDSLPAPRIDEFKLPGVPNHLLTTERVCQRWGDDGSGLAAETMDIYRVAKAPPLDPVTYTEVEAIINASPRRVRRFVYDWWRSSNPEYVATTRRRMSKRGVGRLRIDALNYLKSCFVKSAHADLVALVRFIPE